METFLIPKRMRGETTINIYIYINYLPITIKRIYDVILFADDAGVLVTYDNYDNFTEQANLALA